MSYLYMTDWILEATLAGSILVAMIMLIKKVFKKRLNVTAHYYIWILLIIKLIIPSGPESKISLYNLINPAYSYNSYGSTYENTTKVPINNVQQIYEEEKVGNNLTLKSPEMNEVVPAETTKVFHNKINYKKVFFIIWALGAALASAHAILGIARIKRIILSSKNNNEKLNSILEEAKQTVDIKTKIQLGVTNQIGSPSLFGIFNPIILIPDAVADTLTDRELKYIIIHELCHVKRKDIIISWFKVIFKAIHWFNPIIILGLNTMERDCEISCDNTALSYLGNSENKAYGSTIINVLELVNKPIWLPGSTSIIIKKSDLKRRIKMISSYGKISIGSIFTGIVIILIVAAVGLTDKIAKADISKNTQSSIKAMPQKSLSIVLTDNEEGLKVNTKVDSYYPNLFPYVVNFEDIKGITSELKNLGAVNISVNGELITESSDISPDGQFLKINGNRYKSPFTVNSEWNTDISSDRLLKDISIINNLKSRGIGVNIGGIETDRTVVQYKNSGVILNLHRNDKAVVVYAGKREIDSLIKLLSLDTTKEIYVNEILITDKTVIEDDSEPGYILVDGRKVSTKGSISIKAIGDKNRLYDTLSFPGNLYSEEKFKLYNIDYKMFDDSENAAKDTNTPSKDQTITLYFSDSNAEYLVGEKREIKDATPLKAIQQLFEGPKNKGLHSILPKELDVSNVLVKDSIAQVYIQESVPQDKRGNYGSSTATTHIINSISATLILNKQFGINKVRLEGSINNLLYGVETNEIFDVDMNLIKVN